MKHIVKSDEPPELNNWKNQVNDPENVGWQPTWKNFQNPEKSIVHTALMKDQGYICCYCMREISKETSHIEHVKPRSRTGEEERLSYANMITSCDGEYKQERNDQNEKDEILQQHCGHYRQNWFDTDLYGSPLNTNCESRFKYYDDGKIRPASNDQGAAITIEKLRLDYSLFEKNRKQAIRGVITDELTVDDLKLLRLIYGQRDSVGKFRQYSVAIQQVIQQQI